MVDSFTYWVNIALAALAAIALLAVVVLLVYVTRRR
jgi:hypothetical protein